jgi:hypothetical protein
VLLISGYAQPPVGGSMVLPAGMQFLQKPFEPEDLVRKVRHTIGSAVG